ncbi:carboxypeptidase-like regulatory domain-containing protein [Bradyrhizobium sp.]|uniref:carboxypeptidase-like regulatory domain-containing protein n=1 Tax=Bradyrhizobium sp. TaxID=376 RepID=UPI002CC3474F|nr:carboxypeptidase-like regulatory domain-containing protein [Bradyrhizobium sp.]HMM87568.1 carboxypeptidase-like regulatory domain-containing protein [Bradyrhizobium sp.]
MADPKATLTFKLDTPPNQRWSGALPVEVRDEKLVLRARGVSDDTLEVPPGRYYVTAQLPNGDQATVDGIVTVNPGDNKQLDIPLRDVTFPATLETTNTLADSFWKYSRPVTQVFFRQSFAILHGNWLADKVPGTISKGPLKREPTTRSNLDVPFSREAVWIEIERSKQYNYFAVPVDEGGTTTVEWTLDLDTDKLALKFDFHDGELNSLLDFADSSKANEARSISSTLVTRPDYYATKKPSPLRATLGAYVLIRANQLEGLDEWTGHLVASHPWLPDTLAVRVEYLARSGRHPEALRVLLDVPQSGAPLFRSGVSYLADRAKTYARLAPEGKSSLQVSTADTARLEKISQVFSDLVIALDMTSSTTALRHVPALKPE